MTALGPVPLARRVERAWAFGRHLRPRQVARRFWLDGQRRILVRLGPPAALPGDVPPLAENLPMPLLPARAGMLDRPGSGWRFTFLNRPVDLPAPLAWSLSGSDPRDQLWTMHLHYMEYLEEADGPTFAELLTGWIERNRPYGPGYWRDAWNSYSVSIRAVVWMQQLATRRSRLPEALFRQALASLAEQLRFLERHLETDIGGNHLVKNIKALIWASAFFAGPEADRWRRLGLRLLAAELAEQILPDGVHYERSPSYHGQVFADLLECRHALGGDPFEGRLDDALDRMAQATADLAHPDGLVALFNDAGLTMAYPPAVCLDAYARLRGRTVTPSRHIRYPDAGYYGLRTDRLYFLCDCGPIAPDTLPAHGHGDILSFELSLDGRRIIVDPGVYEYVAGPARQAARSAASHNTVTVPGYDQADFFGAFRSGRRARGVVTAERRGPASLELEGRVELVGQGSRRVRHHRRFEVSEGGLRIADHVKGAGSANGSILLHPEASVECHGGVATVVCGSAVIRLSADVSLATEPANWAPHLGVRVPTTRLVYQAAANDRLGL